MTEAQAAEKEVPGSRADTLHCGRNVALAFTMQVSPLWCRLSSHGLWRQRQRSLHASCACSNFGPTTYKYYALIDPFNYKDAKSRLSWPQVSMNLQISFLSEAPVAAAVEKEVHWLAGVSWSTFECSCWVDWLLILHRKFDTMTSYKPYTQAAITVPSCLSQKRIVAVFYQMFFSQGKISSSTWSCLCFVCRPSVIMKHLVQRLQSASFCALKRTRLGIIWL